MTITSIPSTEVEDVRQTALLALESQAFLMVDCVTPDPVACIANIIDAGLVVGWMETRHTPTVDNMTPNVRSSLRRVAEWVRKDCLDEIASLDAHEAEKGSPLPPDEDYRPDSRTRIERAERALGALEAAS